jgi:hypothetical protein
VVCLLADDHGAWDTDVVRSIFEVEIATWILQIPVSRRGGDDFLSWPHTKFGDYTVASVYNLARTNKFFLDRSRSGGKTSSTTAADSVLWKCLWAIRAPVSRCAAATFLRLQVVLCALWRSRLITSSFDVSMLIRSGVKLKRLAVCS